MIPSVGRIVHYTLSDADVSVIPAGASEIDRPAVGDVCPLLIVRTFGDTEASAVNGRVFLDGQHDLWVTSRAQGIGAGQWFKPPVVADAPAAEKEPERTANYGYVEPPASDPSTSDEGQKAEASAELRADSDLEREEKPPVPEPDPERELARAQLIADVEAEKTQLAADEAALAAAAPEA